RAQGKVYFNPKKQAERFIGTVLDITEEKNREQELKNSVELFTTMADNVPAMIWMSGDDKFKDFFNKTWLEFTGRTIEEESNEGWLDNLHPEDLHKCIDNYNRSLKEERGFYSEYRLKRQDGKYRWIADNSVPRYNFDGTFAGFISACIDIDDQKNFREKIMASELRLKTISNASPVGLWMTDTHAQNTFVNETWIQWTGIPFEKQLGVGWLDRVVEEDKADAPAKFLDCLLKREKYSTEFRIMKPDGQLRWCLTEGYPYYDISGEFAGYAGSVTDITELKKMEERKDDFIKMASHELKTPITSIKGYVQLLQTIFNEIEEEKFQAAKPTIRSSLNTISKQVSKLTRLVSELLDLTRIESGKLELHKTAFNLGDMVEETAQEIRHTTARHAIIVHNDFEGNIYADKDRLSQVLVNLFTNAIKYSPQADNIEVTIEGDKKAVNIKVRDHGIGIDEKDHDKIFQRFYRVEGKSEQTYPGFGIGLFIAGEIVQRHNGTITVESKKDQGAVFTITLPLKGGDN
ncbi:MAG: PAS domain-containing sensor histidine kinase, partial [Bacteroidota bacterium]